MKLVMEALFGREKSLESANEASGGERSAQAVSIFHRSLFLFSSCWTVDKIKIKTHYFMTY